MRKPSTPHFIRAVCLALLWALSAFAQAPGSAVKFDEFGDIQASDLIARLDNLAIQLQNQPTAKAFLVVYRTRRDLPGLSNRYAHRMKNYLVQTRGLSADRVITVDGGVAFCLTQELWIVPPGAAPKPQSVYSNSYEPPAYKFDEHYYSYRKNSDYGNYWQDVSEYPLGYLEAFGQELQKRLRSNGYLIAYRTARDKPQVSRRMLSAERNFLSKEFGINPARLKTIDGGYREMRTMELWIAQGRGAVPIITSYRYKR